MMIFLCNSVLIRCQFFPLHIAGMMLEDFAAEGRCVDVSVDLRGADAFVSEQCLDHTQVGTSFQQGCSKRVSQRVGRDGLSDASDLCLPFDHDEDHRPRQMSTPAVEKHKVFFARFDLHVTTVIKPEAEFLNGLP